MVNRKTTSNSEKILDAMNAKQETRNVKYKDLKGKKHTIKCTFINPGFIKAGKILNNLEVGNDRADIPRLYEMLMNDVIAKPNMSYDSEDKELPKSLKTKTIHTKNKNGEKVNLNFAFPDFRTALAIANTASRPSGAMNLAEVIQSLDEYVIKDNDGRAVPDDYWDETGHCNGLGMVAVNKASDYLLEVLNYNGFNAVIHEASQFLKSKNL